MNRDENQIIVIGGHQSTRTPKFILPVRYVSLLDYVFFSIFIRIFCRVRSKSDLTNDRRQIFDIRFYERLYGFLRLKYQHIFGSESSSYVRS